MNRGLTTQRAWIKLAKPGFFLALLAVLVAACGGDVTPAPLPTIALPGVPSPAPTASPTATAIPFPEPSEIPTVMPSATPRIEPTPPPTRSLSDTIKAEVEAKVRKFGQALRTADAELLASLFLQSEKTTRFSTSEPLRINGWSEVEGSLRDS